MSVGKCFVANFARCRKEADLTQEAVSHMAGLHRTEIGTLERGNRIPRIDTLVKLAATVGVKPEDLLEGIEWKPGKIYSAGFVEVQVPGMGPVQRKVPIERPTKRGS
jgi:transcriptional regulator with XRE-family HTH domain